MKTSSKPVSTKVRQTVRKRKSYPPYYGRRIPPNLKVSAHGVCKRLKALLEILNMIPPSIPTERLWEAARGKIVSWLEDMETLGSLTASVRAARVETEGKAQHCSTSLVVHMETCHGLEMTCKCTAPLDAVAHTGRARASGEPGIVQPPAMNASLQQHSGERHSPQAVAPAANVTISTQTTVKQPVQTVELRLVAPRPASPLTEGNATLWRVCSSIILRI